MPLKKNLMLSSQAYFKIIVLAP